MKKLKIIILSWDTFISLLAVILTVVFMPKELDRTLCISIFGMAISVLSIIFSIFFASLAVIMAFPDNEFIAFMEVPDKLFSRLLDYFKITLGALFVSLIYTISVYVIASFSDIKAPSNKPLFVIFVFFFVYSLFATAIAIDVTLKLTSRRASYLAEKYKTEYEEEENEQD